MRIKKIHISPGNGMPPFEFNDDTNFTVVSGANGSGKTKLVDVLTQLLFGGGGSGDVAVIEAAGKLLVFDGKLRLSDHVNVTESDFRNVFCVRDGNAGFADGDAYFLEAAERLAGLSSAEISEVKTVLQRRGMLEVPTSRAAFGDWQATGKIADKVAVARELIREIEERLPMFLNENYDGLERELVGAERNLKEKRLELRALGQAKSRHTYQQTQNDLEELEAALDQLEGMAELREDEAQRWHALELDKERNRSEVRVGEVQQIRKEKRLEKLNQTFASAKAGLEELEGKRKGAERNLKPGVRHARELQQRLQARQGAFRLWLTSAVVSVVLLAVAIATTLFVPSPFLHVFSGVFVIVAAFMGVQIYRLQRLRGEHSVAMHELRTKAREHGVEFESLDDFDARPEDGNAIEAQRTACRDAEIGRRVIGADLFSVAQKIRVHRENLSEIGDQIGVIEEKTGMASLEEHRRALRQKKRLLDRKREIITHLSGALGKANEANMLTFWRGEIAKRLADVVSAQEPIDSDPIRVSRCEAEMRDVEERIKRIKELIDAGRSDLRDLEVKVTSAAVLDDGPVVCRTTNDLLEMGRRLEAFINDVEKARRLAQQALRVLEDVEIAEKSKITQLFGDGGAVSRYFNVLTGSAFTRVDYDGSGGELTVVHRSGHAYSAERLSTGFVNPLYVAVRLAFGDRMLGTMRGFLVLDDPFARCDEQQLKYQLALLKAVASSGWQIIYLTAKRDVIDALQVDIDNGSVGLTRLGMASQPATHS